LGKVAEVIILRGLKEQEEDLQFGFWRTLSTELQVLRMTEYITEGFNKKKATGAVLLDVFSVGLVKLIRSFLSARCFRVKIHRVHSSYREMEAGVPKVQYYRHFSITFMFQIRLELSEPA